MTEIKFAQSHEWARIEGTHATIGISDYAQRELGDIVFVELPRIGEHLKQGSQFGTVESTKAASELYAPLSGEVVEVNKELVNNPQWINEEPQAKGWMVKIKLVNPSEADTLMDENSYKTFIEKETHS